MDRRAELGCARNAQIQDIVIADPCASDAARLAQGLKQRSLQARVCDDTRTLKRLVTDQRADLVVLELRLVDGPSLQAIEWLKTSYPETAVAVLTRHGSVASAVRCAKLGVDRYYSKPICLDLLLLLAPESEEPTAGLRPLRLDRAVWEYLNRAVEGAGSITSAGRALGVDRRSLRRMLGKYAPPY